MGELSEPRLSLITFEAVHGSVGVAEYCARKKIALVLLVVGMHQQITEISALTMSSLTVSAAQCLDRSFVYTQY